MLKREYREVLGTALRNDIEKELNIPPVDFWKSRGMWDVSIDKAINKKYKVNILCSRKFYKEVKEYIETAYDFKEENLIANKTHFDNIHCYYSVSEDELMQIYSLLRLKGYTMN